jgi:hypothetical protein
MFSAMDNNYPALCHEVGLTCETCTAETARQLARVCQGLRGKMIGQLFVQIHPHSACAPMHAHFAECYREASQERTEPPSQPMAMSAAAGSSSTFRAWS